MVAQCERDIGPPLDDRSRIRRRLRVEQVGFAVGRLPIELVRLLAIAGACGETRDSK
jgi:hypothetical protein